MWILEGLITEQGWQDFEVPLAKEERYKKLAVSGRPTAEHRVVDLTEI